MNTESDNAAALPLAELELTPEWVKSPGKSFEKHPGETRPAPRDRERERRSDRPRSVDRRAASSAKPRPPKSAGTAAPRPPAAPVAAPVEVVFLPDDASLATIITTVKQSPRAYALFDIAKLILNKPERHRVKIMRPAGPDGVRAPLFFVAQSEAPFLTQAEALRFIFQRHLDWVAKTEQKQVEPPKGNFTFVNRCGITGEWLGPPNYHEYQARLVRHHQQRLRHISFEEFKARIQTVRDEAAVQAWVAEMSAKTEYTCLLDAEPVVFTNRAELERHVTEQHVAALVTPIHELVISGPASRNITHPAILQAVRQAWETERRFPIKTVNELRPRLQKEGFYFFKHPNGVTYITHARLKRFEAGASLTPEVQRLLTILRGSKKGVTIKEVLAQFVPPSPADATTAPSPVEERVLADLRWLMGDGYVVELSDGRLWAPAEKQPAPAPAPASSSASAPSATATTVPAPAAAGPESAAPITGESAPASA